MICGQLLVPCATLSCLEIAKRYCADSFFKEVVQRISPRYKNSIITRFMVIIKRGVHQVQIYVICSKPLQVFLNGLRHAVMVVIFELGGNENVLPVCSLINSPSNSHFVPIHTCSVNVPARRPGFKYKLLLGPNPKLWKDLSVILSANLQTNGAPEQLKISCDPRKHSL